PSSCTWPVAGGPPGLHRGHRLLWRGLLCQLFSLLRAPLGAGLRGGRAGRACAARGGGRALRQGRPPGRLAGGGAGGAARRPSQAGPPEIQGLLQHSRGHLRVGRAARSRGTSGVGGGPPRCVAGCGAESRSGPTNPDLRVRGPHAAIGVGAAKARRAALVRAEPHRLAGRARPARVPAVRGRDAGRGGPPRGLRAPRPGDGGRRVGRGPAGEERPLRGSQQCPAGQPKDPHRLRPAPLRRPEQRRPRRPLPGPGPSHLPVRGRRVAEDRALPGGPGREVAGVGLRGRCRTV
ncbi:unnamed protein product, partial [Prorocentrum cordatum]